MSVAVLQDGVQMLRSVELRLAVRGVDAEQARQFLNEAADLLASAAREQEELRGELERLRQANDESVIARALVAATRAGEALVAESRAEAAALTAEAEAQAAALLEEVKAQAERREQETKAAQERFEQELSEVRKTHGREFESASADADAALADARHELAQLERQAAQLSSLVADMERRIVEIAQDALEELEAFAAPSSDTPAEALLAKLHPAADAADVAAD